VRRKVPHIASDLTAFEVIRDKSLLTGSNYFELHPKEVLVANACWLDGSIFIRDAGFNFFCACFERAAPDFDYFAFTRIVPPQLETLAIELRNYLDVCRATSDRTALYSCYPSNFRIDTWDQIEIEPLRSSIIEAGDNIERFVLAARKDTGVLWVMGM